jgi:hypothetical protein
MRLDTNLTTVSNEVRIFRQADVRNYDVIAPLDVCVGGRERDRMKQE